MKNIIIILMIIMMVIATGCSPSANGGNNNTITNSNPNASYKALLFANGKELQSIGETAEEIGPKDLIGTVTVKIKMDERPKVDLTSNYLDEGTEIYSVAGNPDIVLDKKENGEFEVFE